MKKLPAMLALAGLLALGACGGGGSGGGGLSGTVTAPAGSSVQGTEVAACFYLAATDDCDAARSKSVTVSGSGASGGFSVDGLAAGDYGLAAVNQAQGLVGVFADNRGEPILVRPPRSGMSIPMVRAAQAAPAAQRWLQSR